MNRPQALVVAILVAAGILLAPGLVPPTKDMARASYGQGQADGSLFWDAGYYVAWSVPGMLGRQWTCRVHLDIVADPAFIDEGWYECSPWPWASWFQHGRY